MQQESESKTIHYKNNITNNLWNTTIFSKMKTPHMMHLGYCAACQSQFLQLQVNYIDNNSFLNGK